MTVKILVNDAGQPAGKLAEVELHFDEPPLAGLKLIGAAVWQRADGTVRVTMPSRQYSVNGERRSFALLRPIVDLGAVHRLEMTILDAFAAYQLLLVQA